MATADDHANARRIATAAGRVLLELRARHPDPDARRQGLRDAGDAGAQAFIAAELAMHYPDDAVLSEEAADSDARLEADRVWIIDPLDGTREYAEPGRVDSAVHVALWADGRMVACAVGVPATGTGVSTWRPAVLGAAPRPPVVLVSRTVHPG